MARLLGILAFLCILGKLAALGDENSPKVVVFGEGDFEVKSDEGARDSLVWQATKGQKPVALRIEDRKCQCSGTSCNCCAKINLVISTMSVCAGFTFNPSAKTLDFTVTVDGIVVFKKTISVDKPVKYCRDFPIGGKNANICLGLSDISFKEGHTGACIYIEINYKFIHWKQDLGCIYEVVQPINNTKLKAISFFKK
ncbi:uncharacterized protein LOC116302156 [Actinia tenebrosa]|uniref:Uncharacterized protein LOC116302156 n=1 Tax=Actinia tenebrosa TaxID=6105 RepID=A0A6P8IKF6_ACTTE|nr:uncharacterized protein LOC116302156 [Actinia tenebrosa]